MMYLLSMVAVATATNMQVSYRSSLTFNANDASDKNRPVSKVVNLLKDMQKQMEKEGVQDQEAYDKMNCWCITNKKEKTQSVNDATSRISDLQTSIEEKTSKSARLDIEIKNLNKEVGEDQNALAQATALRQKQLKEFNKDEKDLLGSISSLKNAVTVLSKHNGAAGSFFLQSAPHSVRSSIRHLMAKQADVLNGVLTPAQTRLTLAFVQSGAPSSEIFGILSQMKETFETNLATAQGEEATNQKAFEELKAAKEAEVKAGQDQSDTKTEQLAENDEQLAQNKQDLKDTQKSLDGDQEFLTMLGEKCTLNDSEWELRQKSRADEIEAVTKALGVLDSEEAHDQFSKSLGFLQTGMSMNDGEKRLRRSVSKLVSSLASRHQSPRLAALAIEVRLNAFGAVKRAIDEMVTQLGKEKADEIKQRDFCINAFNTNVLQLDKKTREKKDIDTKVQVLGQTITELVAAIKTLKKERLEMQKQLKRAGENREKENKAFQMTVADQRATQKLLNSALTVLKGFYAKSAAAAAAAAAAALTQTASDSDSAAEEILTGEEILTDDTEQPSGFSKLKKSAGAGGVMGMIQQIINDAKGVEKEAIRDEADAQKAYEVLVKTTNAAMETKNQNLVNKAETKSAKDIALVQAGTDLQDVKLELEMLNNAKAELHSSCDFIIKNFAVRQTARDEEVEALKQAKAILSGAKFEAFLQSEQA